MLRNCFFSRHTKNNKNESARFYHQHIGRPNSLYLMPSTIFGDGGQKKLKAVPTSSMLSLIIIMKISIAVK